MPPLLTAELVRLGAKADSKHDAIGQAGALLVAAGVIEPGYVDSLLGRERVSNTRSTGRRSRKSRSCSRASS